MMIWVVDERPASSRTDADWRSVPDGCTVAQLLGILTDGSEDADDIEVISDRGITLSHGAVLEPLETVTLR